MFSSSDAIMSSHHIPERAFSQSNIDHSTVGGSRINGKGIWESWTKHYSEPMYALLDLFDNAIDACYGNKKNGEISITTKTNKNNSDADTSGSEMTMKNNCKERIIPICDILKLYNSTKKNKRHSPRTPNFATPSIDHIGQNGIGTKQACANLSDLSFVLTKNDGVIISVGIIAKMLQTDDAPELPSFEVDFSNVIQSLQNEGTSTKKRYKQAKAMIRSQLDSQIKWRQQQQKKNGGGRKMNDLKSVISTFGKGKYDVGVDRIARKIFHLLIKDENPHIFVVVLDKLRHFSSKKTAAFSTTSKSSRSSTSCTGSGLTELLQRLKAQLPIFYIHIPKNLKVTINEERVDFLYWEKRLIELTTFQLHVHPFTSWKDQNLASFSSSTSSPSAATTAAIRSSSSSSLNNEKDTINDGGNNMRLFVGFDPYRASGDRECKLYIYSRQAGRLITQYHDARSYLKLAAGSTGFCQGLVIILDDHHGFLPLNPTKQDLAFSQQPHGEIYQDNFTAWIGAYVHTYYNYHLIVKFGDQKKALTKQIFESCKDKLDSILENRNKKMAQEQSKTIIKRLSVGKFTELHGLKWHNKQDKIIRMTNKKLVDRKIGKHTLVSLQYPTIPEPEKKMASSSSATKSKTTSMINYENENKNDNNTKKRKISISKQKINSCFPDLQHASHKKARRDSSSSSNNEMSMSNSISLHKNATAVFTGDNDDDDESEEEQFDSTWKQQRQRRSSLSSFSSACKRNVLQDSSSSEEDNDKDNSNDGFFGDFDSDHSNEKDSSKTNYQDHHIPNMIKLQLEHEQLLEKFNKIQSLYDQKLIDHETLEMENSQLKEEVKNNQSEDNNYILQENIESLQTENYQLIIELNNLKKEEDEKLAHHDEEKIALLENEIIELRKEKMKINQEKIEIKESKEKLRENFEKENIFIRKENSKLKEKASKLEEECTEKDQIIDQLKEEKQNLAQDNEFLNNDIAEAQDKIQQLRDRCEIYRKRRNEFIIKQQQQQ